MKEGEILVWGPVSEVSPITVGNWEPSYNLILIAKSGEEVGRFDLSGATLVFSGKADESAEVFVECLITAFSERVKTLVQEKVHSIIGDLWYFQEGQWWIRELDTLVADIGDDDQKRAVAVVHRLLRTIAEMKEKV